MVLAIILILAPITVFEPQPVIMRQASAQQAIYPQSVQTYGVGLSGAPVGWGPINGNNHSFDNRTSALEWVQQTLLPIDVKLLFVDPGWQYGANTTTHFVGQGYQQNLENLLWATYVEGIDVAFFTQQVATSNGWGCGFTADYPQAAPYWYNGTKDTSSNCYYSVLPPYFNGQYKTDITQYYSWYGNFTNWIGFGEGTQGDFESFGTECGCLPSTGPYSNTTLSDYAHSKWFLSLVNSTGYYLSDGSYSKIWHMFDSGTPREYPTIQLYWELGNFSNSNPNKYACYNQGSCFNNWLNYQVADTMYNLTQYIQSTYGRHMYYVSVIGTGGPGSTVVDEIPNVDWSYILGSANSGSSTLGCPQASGRPPYNSCFPINTWQSTAQATADAALSQTPEPYVGWLSFGQGGDNGGSVTAFDIQQQALQVWPNSGSQQFVTFNDWIPWWNGYSILNQTRQQYSIALGTILSRMQYNGGFFGTSKDAIRLLYFSHGSDEGILPELLSAGINVTLADSYYYDQNYSYLGNLRQFNVIFGLPISPTNGTSSSFMGRLESFVQNGGGFVSNDMGVQAYEGDNPAGYKYIQNILGFYYNSTVSGGTCSSDTILNPNSVLIKPYTTISLCPRWTGPQFVPLSNESVQTIVETNLGGPVLTYNNYGSGRGVDFETPVAGDYRIGQPFTQPNAWFSVLMNAIFYAAGRGNMLPVEWMSAWGNQNWDKNLVYSIDGTPGKPVLVWAGNNDTKSSTFDIHLNATFYGISTTGWIAIDMQNMSVIAKGSGSDIHISTVVQGQSWEPIYLLNDTSTSNLQPLYSTASILSGSTSSSIGSIELSGNLNSSSWLILNSPSSVGSVSSSLTGTIPQYSSLATLNQTQIGEYCTSIVTNSLSSNGACNSWAYKSQEGWYYDATNSLLYVHFKSGIPVTLNFSPVTTSSTSTTSFITTTSSQTSSSQTSTTTASPQTSTTTIFQTTTTTDSSTTSSSTPTISPTSYSISFTESGLPAGTSWMVVLGNTAQTSTANTITFQGVAGNTYSWSVNPLLPGSEGTQYVASKSSGSMSVPSQLSQAITYSTQYQVVVSGSPNIAGGTMPSGVSWYNAGSTVQLNASEQSGYNFTSWSNTGPILLANPTERSTTAVIDGPGSITANFVTPITSTSSSTTTSTSTSTKSTTSSSTSATSPTTSTTSTQTTTSSKPSNLVAILYGIPYLSASPPTLLGTSILVGGVVAMTALPFLVKRQADKSKEKKRQKARSWRW